MAKRINLILEDYECICCPKEFNYVKENFTNDILFYKSEKKFPGEIFFAFGPLKTSVIERMWFNGDDKYRYAFFLTKNHFYCFRHIKTEEEIKEELGCYDEWDIY